MVLVKFLFIAIKLIQQLLVTHILNCCIVSLQAKDQGNGELCNYTPPNIKKKFIKTYIDMLDLTLNDSSGHLIPFDAGTVNIECLIEDGH